MPKKSKVGKQRKDRFYKLAKEVGFRSRSAFKLIQLNRKFEFLPKARVLVDLCAAPGGWLQVAKQSMPVSSIIVGVDLVSILPIPNVITFREDITTDRCRQVIKKELRTWKADIVLHDGAPNIGQNWIQDAFIQNQLTLSALKLATEFLVKGGWFITKVFRSRDYLSLVWVFKKLFKNVHVTKPQASRNESAEIFIVCQSYTAPDHIDAKFLDPEHLFKEISDKSESKINVLEPLKNKPKAIGYEDGDTLFNVLGATEFIFCNNHIEKLGRCNEIVFDDDDIRDHKLTTNEVKQCCKDVKVLGKADIRLLLNWRKQLKLAIKGAEQKVKVSEDNIDELQKEEEEMDEVLKEVEDLELEKLREAKRKKKKILKARKKLHDRINLKMIIKDDEPIIDEDKNLFNLSSIKNKQELAKVGDEANLEFEVDLPIENTLDGGYQSTYVSYNRHQEQGDFGIKEDEKAESVDSSDEAFSSDLEFESESENELNEDDTKAIVEAKKNPLMVDLVERSNRVQDTVQKWFDKDDFAEEQEDNHLELDLLAETIEQKVKSMPEEKLLKDDDDDSAMSDLETNGVDEDPNKTIEFDDSGKEIKKSEKSQDNSKKEKKKKRVRLDPEGLVLGSMLIQSKKMRRDIIEASYNRYSSNDDNLPSWFVNDEKKYYRSHLPITKEMVAEYKLRLREINARPVKKVVEAKARKKRRAAKRLEKAKKKAEKITEHPDMSAHEKASQLNSIYKKALRNDDKKVTYVVAKKKSAGRPPPKGRYKIVDRRMKKDKRAEAGKKKGQKGMKINKRKK